MEAMRTRFMPHIIKLRELLNKNVLGETSITLICFLVLASGLCISSSGRISHRSSEVFRYPGTAVRTYMSDLKSHI